MARKPKRPSSTQRERKKLRRALKETRGQISLVQDSKIALQTLSTREQQLEKMLVAYRDLVNNVFKLNLAVSDFDAADEKSTSRFLGKLEFFTEDLPRNCEKAGIRMTDFTGKEYSQNLDVRVMNEEDFNRDDKFVIDEMLEPHLTFVFADQSKSNSLGEQLLQQGLVTIRKIGS
jgi:hypothetical protein